MDKHCALADSFCTICHTFRRKVSPGNIRLRYEELKSHLTLKAKSLTRARASECSNGGATDAGQPGRNWLALLRLGMAAMDRQTSRADTRRGRGGGEHAGNPHISYTRTCVRVRSDTCRGAAARGRGTGTVHFVNLPAQAAMPRQLSAGTRRGEIAVCRRRLPRK